MGDGRKVDTHTHGGGGRGERRGKGTQTCLPWQKERDQEWAELVSVLPTAELLAIS